jgi:hypothetical protein
VLRHKVPILRRNTSIDIRIARILGRIVKTAMLTSAIFAGTIVTFTTTSSAETRMYDRRDLHRDRRAG